MKLPSIACILVGLSVLGCKQQEPQITNIQKVEDKISIPDNVDSDFNIFLEFFNRDSVFQVSRINFPLKIMEMDEDMVDLIPRIIKLDDYKKIDLKYEKSFETREYDRYTQKIVRDDFKVRIEIRGIDNGIYADFEFTKIDGKWKLTTWTDSST